MITGRINQIWPPIVGRPATGVHALAPADDPCDGGDAGCAARAPIAFPVLAYATTVGTRAPLARGPSASRYAARSSLRRAQCEPWRRPWAADHARSPRRNHLNGERSRRARPSRCSLVWSTRQSSATVPTRRCLRDSSGGLRRAAHQVLLRHGERPDS